MKLYHTIVFLLIYLREILKSTVRIGALVVTPRPRLRPRFVEMPLDLRDGFPRFLLACLITMTPGSLTVAMDPERGVIVVHLIDAPDPDAAVAGMKSTLEKPLIRIFGRA